MKVIKCILYLGCLLISPNLSSQIQIGDASIPMEESAVLQVDSESKGILVPHLSNSQMQAISNPANGLLVYNGTKKSYWYYKDVSVGWVEIVSENNFDQSIIKNPDENTDISIIDDQIIMRSNGLEIIKMSKNNNGFPTIQFNNHDNNILIGDNVSDQVEGIDNTMFGISTGSSMLTGNYNTFYGAHSGEDNESDSYNTFLGYMSGHKHNSGNSNVFAGVFSGRIKTGGKHNVFLGYNAGSNNTTIDSCVLIGASSGLNIFENNQLQIKSNNKTIISGDFKEKEVIIDGTTEVKGNVTIAGKEIMKSGQEPELFVSTSGSVGIGKSPAHRLDIDGNLGVTNILRYKTGKRPLRQKENIVMGCTKIFSDGTIDNTKSSTSFFTSTSGGIGKVNLDFDAGLFTKRPLLVGIGFGSNKVVIKSLLINTGEIEIRDEDGDLINSEIMVCVLGEY